MDMTVEQLQDEITRLMEEKKTIENRLADLRIELLNREPPAQVGLGFELPLPLYGGW